MRVRLQISRQSALLDTPAVAPGTIPNSLPWRPSQSWQQWHPDCTRLEQVELNLGPGGVFNELWLPAATDRMDTRGGTFCEFRYEGGRSWCEFR